jgi:Ca2+-transporting ATPase
MDPPEEDVMKRPPRNPTEGVLYGRFASILATFTLQFLLTGGIFYWQYYMSGAYLLPEVQRVQALNYARTMAFMRATLQELLVVWNCRSEKRNAFRVGFFSNKYLLGAVLISAAITIAIPFIPVLGPGMGTVPIYDTVDWGLVILASLSGLFILPEVFYGRKIWKWR